MGTDSAPDPLEEFFSVCPEMLFVLRGDGTLRRLSEPLKCLLGAEAREGAPLLTYIHPDDRRAFDVAWAALAESEAPVRFNCRVRAAEGGDRAMSLSARRAPASGEISGALMARWPAGDPEAAQSKHEVLLFNTLLRNVNLIVWEIDRDGMFTFHRGKALAAAGLRQEQFIGQNAFELFSSHGSGVQAIRAGLEGQLGHVVNEAHGVPWENWFVPLRDDAGDVVGVGGLSLDLTEARRAEMELRAQIELVERQKRVIRAMATPIIEVWDKVLTLPMLGVVDTTRAADVMENLLGQVSQKRARFAILDLTGVETVDTGTASHLLKLVHALRLLGAEGIITGIQPEVAQTMVTLGMDLKDIVTLSNLRDGLRLCMKRMREGAT